LPDDEICGCNQPAAQRLFSGQTGELTMLRKVVTLALIGSSLAIAACNTVRGAAKDVNSAANAVDNAM
jgi:predicted small secreted protein